MNKRFIFLSTIIIFIVGCTQNLLTTLPEPIQYTPPEVETFALSNGIEVFFLEDNELPLVRGVFYFPQGSLLEDDTELGAVNAMGSLMKSGGAGVLSPEAVDEKLEKLSAVISSKFGDEHGTVSFGALSGDTETIISLVTDVITKPRFDAKRLELWKSQALDGIKRRIDSPDTVVGMMFNKVLFKGTRINRLLQPQNINRLNRDALIKAHQMFVRPEKAMLAITGDIEKDKLGQLLEKYIGQWKPKTETLPDEGLNNFNLIPGVYFVRMPFEQATILIGQHGPKRLPPDYAAIEVFNAVLGSDSGFSSRLVKEVRTTQGLAYSISGGIYPDDPIGKNMIGLQTKAETAGEAIERSLQVVHDLQTTAPSVEDVNEAQQGTIYSYVFKFDSTDDVVKRRALLRLLHYPISYDDTYIQKIKQVTGKDLKEVANKYWNLNKLAVVVVGNDEAEKSIKDYLKKKNAENLFKELSINEISSN